MGSNWIKLESCEQLECVWWRGKRKTAQGGDKGQVSKYLKWRNWGPWKGWDVVPGTEVLGVQVVQRARAVFTWVVSFFSLRAWTVMRGPTRQ